MTQHPCLKRHANEDSSRDPSDPEFTIRELANMARLGERQMARLLEDARVGTLQKTGKRGRPRLVVRWSELETLKAEFEQHYEMFG